MSIRLMAEVFETHLPAGEKLVLLAMADHADDSGDNCFPSIPRIAKKASMTRRGVQRILRRLQESNLIRPKGLRPGGTIEYIITLPRGATVIRGGDPRSRGEGRPVVAGGATSVRGGGDRSSPESSLEPPLNHQEEKSVPAPPKAAARPAPSAQGASLAGVLSERILQNNPSAKITANQVTAWAKEADLMMGRDGRSEADIRGLIEWSQADSFWKANILSMGKLREKFDQLTVKRKAGLERTTLQKGGVNGQRNPSASDLAMRNARALGLTQVN